MRLWKICSVGLVLGLLLILASCSKDDTIPRRETETFLNGLASMFFGASTAQSSEVLLDFRSSQPPGPQPGSAGSLVPSTQNIRKLRDPFGLDTLYGTWELFPLSGWQQTDPGNPADAVRFEWAYWDSATATSYDAYVLIDSIEFYEGDDDTLISNMRIGVGLDDSEIAWLKLTVGYVSADTASSASLIYEVVNYYQLGLSITSDFEVDTTLVPDSLISDFVGTVHLWAINRVTGVRIDYYYTMNPDGTERHVLRDVANGWEMIVSTSEVVQTDGTDQRRNVTGEITHNGEHAADIEGYIWKPDDGNHGDQITIIFADDTEGDYTVYTSILDPYLD